ncbi:MAG: hypothetical protein LBF92_03480 [Synergistaceae bacterium]|jgi:hypothetical protein|nr:hypothetical protein [Synergistaceae bacterium]
MAEHDDKVTFRFTKSTAYRVVPATGVWGVNATNGDILCNFVVDSFVLPVEIDYRPETDEEIKRKFAKGKNDIEKELQVGILMTKRTARIVGEFLLNFSRSPDESESDPEFQGED